MQYDIVKKKLEESEEELKKAKKEYKKLKELTYDTMNSLAAERDKYCEEKHTFQAEYKVSEKKLKQIEEELIKVKNEHRRLKEDTDTICDKLVIERDDAAEERYMARVQCDIIKKKINDAGDELPKARKEHNKLKEDTDDIINSLSAERDENCEEGRKFQAEYKESERTLEDFGERSMNIDNIIECDKTMKNLIKSEQTKINQDGKESRRCNDSGIEIDLNVMTIEISQRMDTMLEDKLSKIFMTGDVNWLNNVKVRDRSCEEERVESINSYNTTTKIPETKVRVDPREQNIIIHGINEGKEVRHDAIYLKELFDILEMGHTGPIITHRLGMKKHDRPRPIKLTMKSIDQKEQFMSKLGKLKFVDDEFKKISVTNDYTIVEREEIRRWGKMSNGKNDGMKDYVWKLRGTPKTGMRLVKIRN